MSLLCSLRSAITNYTPAANSSSPCYHTIRTAVVSTGANSNSVFNNTFKSIRVSGLVEVNAIACDPQHCSHKQSDLLHKNDKIPHFYSAQEKPAGSPEQSLMGITFIQTQNCLGKGESSILLTLSQEKRERKKGQIDREKRERKKREGGDRKKKVRR